VAELEEQLLGVRMGRPTPGCGPAALMARPPWRGLMVANHYLAAKAISNLWPLDRYLPLRQPWLPGQQHPSVATIYVFLGGCAPSRDWWLSRPRTCWLKRLIWPGSQHSTPCCAKGSMTSSSHSQLHAPQSRPWTGAVGQTPWPRGAAPASYGVQPDFRLCAS